MSRVMVITGASGGLGRGLAEYFASRELVVCALARGEGRLKAFAEKHPGVVYAYPLDVSKAADVRSVFKRIEEEHGKIDVLVNNAGVVPNHTFGADDFTCIDATIDINLKGTMYCTYAVIPGMVARGDGRIINIASRGGLPGGSGGAGPDEPIGFMDYGASKWGVVGFADRMARVLLPKGVHMTTLCPGGIATTTVSKRWPVPQDSLIQPRQVASLIDFIISQEKNIYFKQMLFIASHEWH